MNKTNYIHVNLNILARDILSGRVSFEVGIGHVPMEEKERFLRRVNRLISEEQVRPSGADRLMQLQALDELVSAAITAAQLQRKSRKAKAQAAVD